MRGFVHLFHENCLFACQRNTASKVFVFRTTDYAFMVDMFHDSVHPPLRHAARGDTYYYFLYSSLFFTWFKFKLPLVNLSINRQFLVSVLCFSFLQQSLVLHKKLCEDDMKLLERVLASSWPAYLGIYTGMFVLFYDLNPCFVQGQYILFIHVSQYANTQIYFLV